MQVPSRFKKMIGEGMKVYNQKIIPDYPLRYPVIFLNFVGSKLTWVIFFNLLQFHLVLFALWKDVSFDVFVESIIFTMDFPLIKLEEIVHLLFQFHSKDSLVKLETTKTLRIAVCSLPNKDYDYLNNKQVKDNWKTVSIL